MRKALLALAAALCLCLAGGPAHAVLRLKAGHTLAPNHPYHLGLVRFSELVAEGTGGEIVIDVYDSQKLGNERDLLEQLQLGTADVTIVSTAPLSAFTRRFLVFDLPFIFPDTAAARRVLDSPFGQAILESVSGIGMVGLVFFENGFRHVTNSRRPVSAPGDLRGMRIRTMENAIHLASFRELGAVPTPMPFGELYTALRKGNMDAQENPIPIIYTSKFYEVQKYCSLTGHFYAPSPLFFSQATWARIGEEHRAVIRQAAAEAREYQRSLIDRQNEEFLSRLREEGMEIAEIDKAAWAEAMLPVYARFEGEIGADVIAEVRAIIAEVPAGAAPAASNGAPDGASAGDGPPAEASAGTAVGTGPAASAEAAAGTGPAVAAAATETPAPPKP